MASCHRIHLTGRDCGISTTRSYALRFALRRSTSTQNTCVPPSRFSSKVAKIGFDRYFSKRMKDRGFAAAYKQARHGMDSVDAFIRSLEEARATAGVSKAKLARLTGRQPAAMRRLLTTDAPNPTLSTVMSILKSSGYGLALVPKRPKARTNLEARVAAHASTA